MDNSIPKLPACIRLLTTSTPPLPIYTYTPANYIGTFLGYRRTLPHRTRTRPDHMRTLPNCACVLSNCMCMLSNCMRMSPNCIVPKPAKIGMFLVITVKKPSFALLCYIFCLTWAETLLESARFLPLKRALP